MCSLELNRISVVVDVAVVVVVVVVVVVAIDLFATFCSVSPDEASHKLSQTKKRNNKKFVIKIGTSSF